jgi:hypothetical protein
LKGIKFRYKNTGLLLQGGEGVAIGRRNPPTLPGTRNTCPHPFHVLRTVLKLPSAGSNVFAVVFWLSLKVMMKQQSLKNSV